MRRRCLLLVFMTLFGLSLFAKVYTIQDFEEEVWRLTNQERQRHSLPALQYEQGLAELGRIHSLNMVKHSFFAHRDHLGDEVADRQKKYYPKLVVTTIGENLAKFSNTAGTFSPREVVAGWMMSPAHKENVLHPDYTHTGVGIVLKGSKLYVTQTFASPLVRLRSKLPTSLDKDNLYRVSFDYLSDKDIERFGCTLIYPDPEMAYKISDEQEMVGAQPLEIEWREGNRFSVLLPFLAGRGNYKLCFGYNGGYFPDGVVVTAK